MRTLLALATVVAIVSPALAQSSTDKISLAITRAELQVIGQGVMELPYKVAAPVLATLQQQLAASDQAAAKVAADAKAAAEKPAPTATPPAADATSTDPTK